MRGGTTLPLPTRARNVSGNTLEEANVDGTAVDRKCEPYKRIMIRQMEDEIVRNQKIDLMFVEVGCDSFCYRHH